MTDTKRIADRLAIAGLAFPAGSNLRGAIDEAIAALAGQADAVRESVADNRALLDAAAEAWSTLDAVAEYLADREDVIDGDYGVPEPNAEMKLLREVIIDRDNLAIQITRAQGDLITGATP